MICPFVYSVRLIGLIPLSLLALAMILVDNVGAFFSETWADLKVLSCDAYSTFKDALKGKPIFS